MQLYIPTMTITSLDVDPPARRAAIELQPRGLVALVLGLFGLSKSQSYYVDPDGYRVLTSSSAAVTQTYIPWPHAAGCSLVSSKPIEWLLAGVGLVSGSASFLLQQVWLQGGAMLLAGLVLVVMFLAARRRTSVRILADSGASETFKVCPDAPQTELLQEYYELLQELISEAEGTADAGPPKPREHSAPPAARRDQPLLTSCPRCHAEIKIRPAFIGRRAHCPSCGKPFVVNVPPTYGAGVQGRMHP